MIMIFCMCAITTRSGALHKRRQNFLGGEGILKFLILDKVGGGGVNAINTHFDMVKEGVKKPGKNSDIF